MSCVGLSARIPGCSLICLSTWGNVPSHVLTTHPPSKSSYFKEKSREEVVYIALMCQTEAVQAVLVWVTWTFPKPDWQSRFD